MAQQLYVWDIRTSCELDTAPDLWGQMMPKGIVKMLTFQRERSDSGYIHFQGRISLIKKKRKTELMKLLASIEVPVPEYLQPSVVKTKDKAAFYALKSDSRIEGPWTEKDFIERYVPRQWRGKHQCLRPWQKWIWDRLDVFEPRTVWMIVDRDGGAGKSTLAAVCKYYKKGCYRIPTITDPDRLMQSVHNILSSAKERQPKALFLDLPRGLSKRWLRGILSVIEEIKNGHAADSRNSYKEWDFDSPQVYVFTNTLLNTDMLSADRWSTRILKSDEEYDLEAWEAYLGQAQADVRPGKTACPFSLSA